MPIRFRIVGLDTATAQIRAAAHQGMLNGLEICGARGAQLVQQNITRPYLGRPPAVATGNLANSISFRLDREVSMSRAVVFAAPPADTYVDAVETGTMPHFPPVNALLLWVRKKFAMKDEKQALSISFAIAHTIAKRGTFGFGMFARAFTVLQGEVQGIMQNAIATALEAAGLAK